MAAPHAADSRSAERRSRVIRASKCCQSPGRHRQGSSGTHARDLPEMDPRRFARAQMAHSTRPSISSAKGNEKSAAASIVGQIAVAPASCGPVTKLPASLAPTGFTFPFPFTFPANGRQGCRLTGTQGCVRYTSTARITSLPGLVTLVRRWFTPETG